MELNEDVIKGYMTHFRKTKVNHIIRLLKDGCYYLEISMSNEFDWIDKNLIEAKTYHWYYLLQRICHNVNSYIGRTQKLKGLVDIPKNKSIYIIKAK